MATEQRAFRRQFQRWRIHGRQQRQRWRREHRRDTGANSGGASTGDTTGGASTSAAARTPPTLADVCATANIGARIVEVQATPDGANYDAWKVTLQGAPENSQNSGAAGRRH